MNIEKDYQEKIEKLEAEMKERNLAIARRIEQFLEDAQSEIVAPLHQHYIRVVGKHNNVDCVIRGCIDHQDIIHLVVTKTVRYNSDENYMRRVSQNTNMHIEGNFSLFFEYIINAHESELEQELEKALTELSHYHD
jgi:hypothetical protein